MHRVIVTGFCFSEACEIVYSLQDYFVGYFPLSEVY